MKMYSPDGKAQADIHPSKIQSMENLGWTYEKKSFRKKKPEPVEAPQVPEEAPQVPEEVEIQEDNES